MASKLGHLENDHFTLFSFRPLAGGGGGGRGCCPIIRTLKQPFGEIRMGRNGSPWPAARISLPAV